MMISLDADQPLAIGQEISWEVGTEGAPEGDVYLELWNMTTDSVLRSETLPLSAFKDIEYSETINCYGDYKLSATYSNGFMAQRLFSVPEPNPDLME